LILINVIKISSRLVLGSLQGSYWRPEKTGRGAIEPIKGNRGCELVDNGYTAV
jgi:hypothetical protein